MKPSLPAVSKPDRKVTAAGAGAAAAPVIVGLAVWFGAPDPPPGFEGALSTVFAFLAGYLIPER